MLGKVRPTAHRGNGSDPQPDAGLSEGRLALVHRYMIDAEEAEARVRAAAEKDAARPRQETRHEAVEEVARGNGRPDARDEARARKALAQEDKRAAKQAARRIAALEKKEARERKALAKAAARRRSA